jgi:hypothetical protein
LIRFETGAEGVFWVDANAHGLGFGLCFRDLWESDLDLSTGYCHASHLQNLCVLRDSPRISRMNTNILEMTGSVHLPSFVFIREIRGLKIHPSMVITLQREARRKSARQ